jgi:hypothetical protein
MADKLAAVAANADPFKKSLLFIAFSFLLLSVGFLRHALAQQSQLHVPTKTTLIIADLRLPRNLNS